MPNHCETDFFITGNPYLIDEVLDLYFDKTNYTLDCDKVIPYPQVYKDMDAIAQKWEDEQKASGGKLDWSTRPKDGFNLGGYEWCCNNWGTKWGTYDGKPFAFRNLVNNRRTVKTSFSSAWSPPTPVMDLLATKYPDLRFKAVSYEMGMAYKIVQIWEKGDLVTRKESKYNGHRGG